MAMNFNEMLQKSMEEMDRLQIEHIEYILSECGSSDYSDLARAIYDAGYRMKEG